MSGAMKSGELFLETCSLSNKIAPHAAHRARTRLGYCVAVLQTSLMKSVNIRQSHCNKKLSWKTDKTARRIYRSVKVTKHCTMLGSCAIVTLSLRLAVFSDIRLQKCRDLKNRIRGPSKSLEMSPFDRAHMTSYWRSVVTMAVSHLVSFLRYSMSKTSWPWNRGQRSLNVIENGTIG